MPTTHLANDTGRMDSAGPARRRLLAASIVSGVLLALTVIVLRLEGRRWWCACQQFFIWAGDTKSSHCSQHLFDPYAFTHVLHGVALCGILALAFPRLPGAWGFVLTLAVEAVWEIVENSSLVIDRYRTATAALGYEGDTIVNAVGDIGSCLAGWAVARRLGWRWSIALWLVVEVVLLFWIRDNLFLNVVMLLFPVDALKQWQLGL